MDADDLVRRLLKHPLVGLECVAAAPHGLALPQNPDPPPTLPCSRCRALRVGDGSCRSFFLHYGPLQRSRVAVHIEPIDWTLGTLDQLAVPGLAFTDEDGVIVHHNAALLRLLSVPSTALVGRKLTAVGETLGVRAGDGESVFRTAHDGPATPEAFRIRHAGGKERTLRVQGSSWRYRGLRCGTVWLAADATEDVEERQQAALAMWYRFGAMFEHELRNPLQTIQAATDVIRSAVPPDKLPVLDLLEGQVRSISEYIGDLLQAPATAALTLGRVSDVVKVSISGAAARAATRQLVFDHRVPEHEPPVRLHFPSLVGAFAHLFRNSAEARRDATVRIDYEIEGSVLGCTVTDNGPGFPHGIVARSLVPWDRDALAHLGLLIVASTVEAHGGAVTMSNPPEGGASVGIRLPAAPRVRRLRMGAGTGGLAAAFRRSADPGVPSEPRGGRTE